MKPGLSRWIRLIAALAAISLLGSLAGCTAPGSTLEAIEDVLRDRESEGRASVDFRQVHPGNWESLLVVCSDATADQVDDLLEFEWQGSGVLERGAFVGLIGFVDGNTVVEVPISGDEFDSDLYALPCPIDGTLSGPVLLNRGDAVINFYVDDSNRLRTFWAVSGDEVDRLRELSN